MKTEINIPNEAPKELKFPLLARFKQTRDIYRFATPERATRMLDSDGHTATNHERWFESYPVSDSDSWEILPPGTTLTLIQE